MGKQSFSTSEFMATKALLMHACLMAWIWCGLVGGDIKGHCVNAKACHGEKPRKDDCCHNTVLSPLQVNIYEDKPPHQCSLISSLLECSPCHKAPLGRDHMVLEPGRNHEPDKKRRGGRVWPASLTGYGGLGALQSTCISHSNSFLFLCCYKATFSALLHLSFLCERGRLSNE
uniref:Uncharacterized protein n=1 Tax=Anguilla anguilla TaxID=7936 RepID=A0A0E9X348_ANGAN